VVRFPIEEKRVETEFSERAFERSSANPRKREKKALGGEILNWVFDPVSGKIK
jgi:hypothetical protein